MNPLDRSARIATVKAREIIDSRGNPTVEVEVGLEDSDESEIVAGLSESDLVVTLGQQTLKPGTRISITTAEKELAKSAGLSAEEALKAAEEAKKKRETPQASNQRHRRLP